MTQVIQIDREAAAHLLGGAAPDGLLDGRCDTLSLVQTLAAHRIVNQNAIVNFIKTYHFWQGSNDLADSHTKGRLVEAIKHGRHLA